MKNIILGLVATAAIAMAPSSHAQTNAPRKDFTVWPLALKDVQVTDSFWTPRLDNNRTVTVPALFERYGNRPDLRLIEAACYLLIQHPDPALQSLIDGKLDAEITSIRRLKGVWPTAGDGSGFAGGNFLETAVAYYEATGSRKLLDVAIEMADDLDNTFGPSRRHDIFNHEGIEIGLVRLYRCTKDEKYLRLAKFFLDARGNPAGRPKLYGPYAQDQVPVINQTRAIGHSVRATYLYMPVTDLAALTGDAKYGIADERIWEDALSKRTYLTGGIGTYRDEEDFGDDYDLPNLACWNEICAAYGNTLWNEKFFQFRQESKYVDVMERLLYNAFLVGVSLKGDTYLYQAPLKAYGDFTRHDWFGPNCCPPNLARLLAQFPSLVYARSDKGVYVNLFVGSKASLTLNNTPVSISQETQFPWDGKIKIAVNPEKTARFAVLLRIPGWVRDVPLPEKLYRYGYLSPKEKEFNVMLNGAKAAYSLEKGYARIEREWKAGDMIEYTLPMPIRRVMAAEWVMDDRGMVGIERGPLVFCAEQADNPGGVFNLELPDNADLRFEYHPEVLGGIGEIVGKAQALSRGIDKVAIVRTDKPFTAIPYYAFGNRSPGEMSVWLAHEDFKVKLPPRPSIAFNSKASSSVGNGTVKENYPGHTPPTTARRMYPLSQDGSGDIASICDQLEPVNSEDGSGMFLRLHPQEGDGAWVQYDFARPEKISSVEVYWKDDKQFCVLPKSWKVLYKDGNDWRPVGALDAYTVAKDKFNRVGFSPVTTTALRLDIQLQPKVYATGALGPPDANYMSQDTTWYEGGVIEWRVNP